MQTGHNLSGVDPKQKIDSFAVGASNCFAHAATWHVANEPSSAPYNPILVYGRPGSGKTHLLHAVGNHIIAQKNSVVRYLTVDDWRHSFVKAVKERDIPELFAGFRRIGVLLLDNAEVLRAMTATYKEFAWFVLTIACDISVVIASSCSPKDDPLGEWVDERCSRSLIVEIELPDSEMRSKMLGLKAASLGFPVPTDVLNIVANREVGGVREMIGDLLRVVERARVLGCAVSTDIAVQALDE